MSTKIFLDSTLSTEKKSQNTLEKIATKILKSKTKTSTKVL